MRDSTRAVVLVSAFLVVSGASGGFVHAQVKTSQAVKPPEAKPAATSASSTAPEANWITRCGSQTRTGSLECSMEQSAFKTDTRQLVAMFSIRIPSDTRAPVLMVQTPLGVFLPGGLQMQVDDGKAVDLPLQMCDGSGCYAGTPLTDQFSEQLQRGTLLHLSFQNMAHAKLDVTMPLAGFGSAYGAIK